MELLIDTFAGLRDVAHTLTCIVLQQDLCSCTLRRLGFAGVMDRADFSLDFTCTQEVPDGTVAVLFIYLGLELDETALQVLSRLTGVATWGPILVPLLVNTPPASAEVAQQLREVRCELFHSGADDVITLYRGQRLLPETLTEVIDRIEMKALMWSSEVARIQQEAATQVRGIQDAASRRMQNTWRKQLWRLPSETLCSIPAQNDDLDEWNDKAEKVGLGRIADYEFLMKIGGGHCSTVFRAEHPTDGQFTIKIVHKSSLKHVRQIFFLDQELGCMQRVAPHPNVIRLRESFQTEDRIYIVMDYAGFLDLHSFSLQVLQAACKKALPTFTMRSFALQQVSAVCHLHSALICHRDIKPCNFVVSDSGTTLRLVDFGMALFLCKADQRLSVCSISLPFCAPEVLRQEVHGGDGYTGLEADCWSLGATLAELVLGPGGVERLLGWVPQYPRGEPQRLAALEGLEAQWTSAGDMGVPKLKDAISQFLLLDPTKRWTAKEALSSNALQLDSMAQNLHCGAQGVHAVAVSSPTLLEKLGGVDTVENAVDYMLDVATTTLLNKCRASTIGVRQLYTDLIRDLFAADAASNPKDVFDSRMTAAHAELKFSDTDFDVLMFHFKSALTAGGIHTSVIREAQMRLGTVRSLVTCAFHKMWIQAKSRNTWAWKSKMSAAAQETGCVAAFAKILTSSLAMGHLPSYGALPHWLNPQGIEGNIKAFLSSEDPDCRPLPLLESALNAFQLSAVVGYATQALDEAGWSLEDAAVLHVALLESCNLAKLRAELTEMARHSITNWIPKVLLVYPTMVANPLCKQFKGRSDFAAFLGAVGEMLSTRQPGGPLAKLAERSLSLNFGPAHFDVLLYCFEEACVGIPPLAVQQALTAIAAMRPWATQSSVVAAGEEP